MKPIVLFRHDRSTEQEKNIVKHFLPVSESRVNLKDSLVIGRYSVLPYYPELEADLKLQGSQLVNSYLQHCYVANFDYYHDLKEYTFKTWFRLEDIRNERGPFILKGATNSRKHEWSKFYAENFQEAVRVYTELQNDSLIGNQQIIIRQYEKLKNFGTSITGIPFANEWRFFFYKEHLLSYGFYWTGVEKKPTHEEIDPAAIQLAKKVATITSGNVNFVVIDVAQKEDGSWVLVELNDGQQSGLSDNDPEELYSNLAKVLKIELK